MTEKCTEFNINIPGDNQHYLVKLINRRLFSEALELTNDNGKGVWLKLLDELGELLGKGTPKVEAPDPNAVAADDAPADGAGGVAQATGGVTNDDLSFHKIREFKINDTVHGGKRGHTEKFSALDIALFCVCEVLGGAHPWHGFSPPPIVMGGPENFHPNYHGGSFPVPPLNGGTWPFGGPSLTIHHFGVTDAMTVCPIETKESNNISLLLHFLFTSQHIGRRTPYR